MNKQLAKIQKSDVHDEDELNNLLNEDSTHCCPRKKRRPPPKPVATPVKRAASTNREYLTVQPPAKKPNMQQHQSKIAKAPPTKVSPRTSTNSRNSEIVCTPDIMGLFNGNDDSAIPKTNMVPSTSIAPPPLIMRNNQQRVTRPQMPIAPVPSPIYHNVNGFQIDLNHAARQEIFRLPNGKLIQVRKQSAPQVTTPFKSVNTAISARQPQFTIRQTTPMTTTARMFRPQMPQPRPRMNNQAQHRFSFSEGRVVATPVPQATAPSTPLVPTTLMSSVFTQQNGSISVARATQPNTSLGKAKTEFEDKIISGLEICQHTINKMITLTNSSSFKQSRSFTDLKDLYIHLEYLFNYTADKFKTLQENLKTGKESLEKHDVESKEKCDIDELEIVEQKTDVIEVLSDDDEDESAPVENVRPMPASAKRQLSIANGSSESANAELATAVASITADDSSSSTLTAIIQGFNTSQDLDSTDELISKDKKLQKKVVVKVEKLENTKNPIIKQFLNQLHERLEKQSLAGSSREGTPTSLLDFELTLNEIEKSGEKEKTSPKAIEVIDDDEKENEKDLEVTSTESEGDEKEKDKKFSEETSESSENSFHAMKVSEPLEICAGHDKDVKEFKKKDDVEDDSEITKQLPGAESSTDTSKKPNIMKIDNFPPTELMEVDDSDIIEINDSLQLSLDETIESLKSPKTPLIDERTNDENEDDGMKTDEDSDKEILPKKNEDKAEKEARDEEVPVASKENEFSAVTSSVDKKNIQDKNSETNEDKETEVVSSENGIVQKEKYEGPEKPVENGFTKSPSPEDSPNPTDAVQADVITNGTVDSDISSGDNILTSKEKSTQDSEDEKMMLDNFFEDLEEHVM